MDNWSRIFVPDALPVTPLTVSNYLRYDTIRYGTVYLRALKSWRDGQLSL